MNTCKYCGHPAINHFVLGTECNIEGCECMNSQRQIILDDGTATIAAQKETIRKLTNNIDLLLQAFDANQSSFDYRLNEYKLMIVLQSRALLAEVSHE